MTRGGITRHFLSEIKIPLMRAIQLLRPRYEDIFAAWAKKLRATGIDEQEIEFLRALSLESLESQVEDGNAERLRTELQNEAQKLEENGLSEAQIVTAMGLYMETCLPFLYGAGKKGMDQSLAFIRLLSAAQSVLLASYVNNRDATLRRVQERERHNLSRDLHDDIGHNLLVLKLYLEMMSMDLKKGEIANVESKLQEALALVSYAVDSVRRLMLDLGPAMLSQFGFLRALRIYARQFALRTGIDVQIKESGVPESLAPGQETALYRVLQGALSNILQHSHAKHVKLNMGITKTRLVMSIEDDGSGFDVSGTLPQRAFGIMAMRERVELLGGKFHIESSSSKVGARNRGTRIEIDLPLDEQPGRLYTERQR
jgi:signal transduction histidine kinase